MSLFLLDYFGSIIQIRTAAVPPPGVPRLTKKQRNLRMKKIALFICVAALAGVNVASTTAVCSTWRNNLPFQAAIPGDSAEMV